MANVSQPLAGGRDPTNRIGAAPAPIRSPTATPVERPRGVRRGSASATSQHWIVGAVDEQNRRALPITSATPTTRPPIHTATGTRAARLSRLARRVPTGAVDFLRLPNSIELEHTSNPTPNASM